MARPLSKPEDLKNPRRVRKSQTVAQQLPIKEPSKAEKKRWATLVSLCVAACLATDREDNIMPKEKVRVAFTDYSKRPAWFPTGRFVEKSGKSAIVDYSCDLLLRTLYEQRLADYSPHDLYRAKSGLLSQYQDVLDINLEFDL